VARPYHGSTAPVWREGADYEQEGVALIYQHVRRSWGDLAKRQDHLGDDICLGDAVNINFLFIAPAKSRGVTGIRPA